MNVQLSLILHTTALAQFTRGKEAAPPRQDRQSRQRRYRRGIQNQKRCPHTPQGLVGWQKGSPSPNARDGRFSFFLSPPSSAPRQKTCARPGKARTPEKRGRLHESLESFRARDSHHPEAETPFSARRGPTQDASHTHRPRWAVPCVDHHRLLITPISAAPAISANVGCANARAAEGRMMMKMLLFGFLWSCSCTQIPPLSVTCCPPVGQEKV